MRFGRVLFGILLALLLVAVVAGVGWYGYNMGVAQGMVTSGSLTAPVTPGGTVPPVPYYFPYGFRPFGFFHPFGFGFLGCLFPILFVLFLFALFRFVIIGPRWQRGWGGAMMGGPGKWDDASGDIPPAVREYHRKLHEEDASTSPAAPKDS